MGDASGMCECKEVLECAKFRRRELPVGGVEINNEHVWPFFPAFSHWRNYFLHIGLADLGATCPGPGHGSRSEPGQVKGKSVLGFGLGLGPIPGLGLQAWPEPGP